MRMRVRMADKLAVALFFSLPVKHLATPTPHNPFPLKKKYEMFKENKMQTGFSRFGEAEAQVDKKQQTRTQGKEFYEDASLEAQQKRWAS